MNQNVSFDFCSFRMINLEMVFQRGTHSIFLSFFFFYLMLFFVKEKWQNTYQIKLMINSWYLSLTFLSPDLYGNKLYLQGMRKDASSPFLNDFGGEMIFFLWNENEPESHSESIYLRTSISNSTLMEVSRGEIYRRFLCYIM